MEQRARVAGLVAGLKFASDFCATLGLVLSLVGGVLWARAAGTVAAEDAQVLFRLGSCYCWASVAMGVYPRRRVRAEAVLRALAQGPDVPEKI